MRRRPNPWILWPALIMGLLAGGLGWVVTDLVCRDPFLSDTGAGCPGWAALAAAVSFTAVTVGVAIVLVLVFRSIAEWRERRRATG